MGERDPVLRRVEQTSVVVCLVTAAVSWAAARGRIGAPLGTLGGGLLVAVSYRGIKAGIDAMALAAGGARRAAAMGLVKFFTRYAILAGAAYLIMARFAFPPLAVFAGASSFVVAVAIEALRPYRPNPPRHTSTERNIGG